MRQHGFAEVRRRGSHIVMQKRLSDTTITVPVPDHAELRVGTLRSIIRQSELPRSLFER
jgi:predicted RNA binding protein YcfA (HicA-like mRNA interferase family)